MAKIKKKDREYNGQNKKKDKTIHRKLKIEQHETLLKRGEPRCSGRVSSSCTTQKIKCR
jgi:hypothetical protein